MRFAGSENIILSMVHVVETFVLDNKDMAVFHYFYPKTTIPASIYRRHMFLCFSYIQLS